ncbi:hypothetical protein SAMN05444164_4165 [Bradyrhizobium erythrophlei]|uniref:Uncharacterized protein n=1 Tax=Bradyrhizobium erythrophlei TaxID=1437360 RepID=A0A1H4YYW7_9BRAD|nr:hypothetical protein SAMN05444164_4165 [Bradyrhizobium erythrophlei]
MSPFQMSAAKLQIVWQRVASSTTRRCFAADARDLGLLLALRLAAYLSIFAMPRRADLADPTPHIRPCISRDEG